MSRTVPPLIHRWRARLVAWWRARWGAPKAPPSARRQAEALIAAIDAGGLPLNPARVNAIARDLGLEVSRHAPMEATVERIRAALQRG